MRLNPKTFFPPFSMGQMDGFSKQNQQEYNLAFKYLGRISVIHTDRRAGLGFLHTNHPKLDGSICI